MALRCEISDIRSLIDEAVSGMEPLAMTKKVDIKVETPQDLPHVKMDGERVLQALRNLIGNAIKFTPEGGRVTISAQTEEKALSVSVADTGPGIPKGDIDAIFDKFRQATLTSHSKIDGTGLGLAIVKHIINAHGGRVWVRSELGRGSTFIFQLPA